MGVAILCSTSEEAPDFPTVAAPCDISTSAQGFQFFYTFANIFLYSQASSCVVYLTVVLTCFSRWLTTLYFLAMCEYPGFVCQSVAGLTSRRKCKEASSQEQFKAEGRQRRCFMFLRFPKLLLNGASVWKASPFL